MPAKLHCPPALSIGSTSLSISLSFSASISRTIDLSLPIPCMSPTHWARELGDPLAMLVEGLDLSKPVLCLFFKGIRSHIWFRGKPLLFLYFRLNGPRVGEVPLNALFGFSPKRRNFVTRRASSAHNQYLILMSCMTLQPACWGLYQSVPTKVWEPSEKTSTRNGTPVILQNK